MSRGGLIQATEEMHEGRFTRSRGTHNRDKFPTMDGQSHTTHCENLNLTEAVTLGQILNSNELVTHGILRAGISDQVLRRCPPLAIPGIAGEFFCATGSMFIPMMTC